jgi:hypothetical protein
MRFVKFLVQAQMHSVPEQTAIVSVSGIREMFLAPNELHAREGSIGNPLRFVSRPSSETGAKYEQVTRAYIATVHSVLAGEKSAPLAAASLEKQLSEITRFQTGPPLKR